MNDYLLALQQACGDDILAQDSIDYAIFAGWVKLIGDFESDCAAIRHRYNEIIESYQRIVCDNEAIRAQLHAPLNRELERRERSK